MKCVILAGGQGTRLREETEFKPKPLVKVGSEPILWHLIKYFEQFGVKEFIICAGYKGEMISEYFLENKQFPGLNIKIEQTGEESNTGERLRRISYLIEEENFFCTYGDGLADIDLRIVQEIHDSSNKIVTLCATRPLSRFGVIDFNEKDEVINFREKPILDSWINIGFFIFNRQIFKHINQNSILETDVLVPLAKKREVNAYKHNGFWQPMDTYREAKLLNEIWERGNSPWRGYLNEKN
jgi:glucose-1-phosphate cytidylyltransferase